MADLPPPEMLRQPIPDVVHVNNTQTLNTLSIGGKTYQILDVGYVCGNTSCTVLSENTCLFSPAPYCAVCATCFHPEGSPPSPVPDFLLCGIPVGLYGILVQFKPPWFCHCLKLLGYVSTNVNLIQPIGTVPVCGASSIPPPLHGFNPFPIIAGTAIAGSAVALNSATLPSGKSVSFDSDGGGAPFRPGIDSDIDLLPQHPTGSLVDFNGCSNEQFENIHVEEVGKCEPTAPQNAVILTIPQII